MPMQIPLAFLYFPSDAPAVVAYMILFFCIIAYITLPRWLLRYLCVIPAFLASLFISGITSGVISDKAPTLPIVGRILIQIEIGVVVFILLMIFLLKVLRDIDRSIDNNPNSSQDSPSPKEKDDE